MKRKDTSSVTSSATSCCSGHRMPTLCPMAGDKRQIYSILPCLSLQLSSQLSSDIENLIYKQLCRTYNPWHDSEQNKRVTRASCSHVAMLELLGNCLMASLFQHSRLFGLGCHTKHAATQKQIQLILVRLTCKKD